MLRDLSRRSLLLLVLTPLAALLLALYLAPRTTAPMATATPVSSFRLPPQIFNSTLRTRLLTLWFGDLPRTCKTADNETRGRWFGFGAPSAVAAFDAQCVSAASDALAALSPRRLALPAFTTFAADRAAALTLSAPFRAWISAQETRELQAETGLSLVLLLDQMPRNVFRDPADQGVIYAHYDRLARALVHAALAEEDEAVARLHLGEGAEWRYSPPWRQWFLLPLMHSEDPADHETLTREVRRWREEHPGDEAVGEMADDTEAFEKRHSVLVERFGRYPYRNAALGRESTREEVEYMEGGGENFADKSKGQG